MRDVLILTAFFVVFMNQQAAAQGEGGTVAGPDSASQTWLEATINRQTLPDGTRRRGTPFVLPMEGPGEGECADFVDAIKADPTLVTNLIGIIPSYRGGNVLLVCKRTFRPHNIPIP